MLRVALKAGKTLTKKALSNGFLPNANQPRASY
jgi:hypothetical protein